MDLDAVRTFTAVVDAGRFAGAADRLAVTQQAVSKRIAALEKDLGVRLFTRTARGTRLTADGQAFLPHARDLLRAHERALASVRPGGRALRVDVLGRRIAPASLLRGFHHAQPEVALDIVTLPDLDAALAALLAGTVDATFRAVTAQPLPDGVLALRVLDEPVQLLTGPAHPLAAAAAVRPSELAGHRIWMPTLAPGAEWTAYYDALAAAFGLSVEVTGPHFGTDPVLDTIAAAADLATFVGELTHLVWADGWDLRRIAVRDPVPVYPHSLLWHRDNPHPGLARLRAHLAAAPPTGAGATWTPAWISGGASHRADRRQVSSPAGPGAPWSPAGRRARPPCR